MCIRDSSGPYASAFASLCTNLYPMFPAFKSVNINVFACPAILLSFALELSLIHSLSVIDQNKYSVHKVRHTAATLMYKYGNVDIRALQELLGHESISTTEIYTHVDNDQIREAVEKNPLAKL